LRRRRPYNRINPVPIKLLSGQGFDFVLSDEGLELAQPPKPSSCPASTYLRYTFRKVGEAPILIPNTASSVRAPILGGFPPDHPRRSHAMSAFGALSNETAGIPTHVNLWSTQISDLVSSFPPFSQNCSTEEWLMTMFGEDHDPKNERDEERVLRLDLAAYQFINRPKRDWQLTGAVYSGIMRELPRIFASVWYTEATSCACDDSGDACGDDYRTRYERNPRDLLEERIEAWLPEKLNYTEWDQDVTEVIFEQSEGEGKMRLPMIPTAPSVDEMMQEWIAGQSVNPQFTDCVRTH